MLNPIPPRFGLTPTVAVPISDAFKFIQGCRKNCRYPSAVDLAQYDTCWWRSRAISLDKLSYCAASYGCKARASGRDASMFGSISYLGRSHLTGSTVEQAACMSFDPLYHGYHRHENIPGVGSSIKGSLLVEKP